MAKLIVYTNSNGIAAIVSPSPNAARYYKRAHGWADGDPEPLESDVLDWIRIKDAVGNGGATDSEVVDSAQIPQDRTFRNAWVKGVNSVSVDMPKAREVARGKIRNARAAVLAKLDADYIRADEAGDTAEKARIAAQKQVLRDAPSDTRIDAAKTPDELKNIKPGGLDWIGF